MEHGAQERDGFSARRVTRIGTVIVVVTILASVIAYALLRWHLAGVALSEPRTEVTQLEIAGVEQVHALDGWAVRLQVEQRKHLESYGWADAGRVHVPIEKAMHDEALRGAE
ncbi:MAG: hypothetical protein H7Z43_06830 [Clostridia bacterium]|nr:hypothetical protein [Deltaproteobacteria bacterium]